MTISRNGPCPCGSGKKFKRCCGSTASPAVTQSKQDVKAILRAAVQNLNAGRLPAAEQLLRQAYQYSPDNAEVCNLLGIVHAQTNRFDTAVGLIQKAVRLMPNNELFRYNLGNAQSSVGQYEDAVANLEMVLRKKPAFAEAENNLGMALCALNRFNEAHVHFRKAIDIRPNYAHAYENLGNALLQLDQVDAALEALQTARGLQTDTAQLLNNLANAYSEKGDEKSASVLYEQALAIEERSEIQKNRGMHALGNRDYLTAIQYLEKALLKLPKDPTIHYGLADAYENTNDYSMARTYFERAAKHGFNQAAIEFRLGGVCRSLGEFEKATVHYDTALSLDPELSDSFIALAQIARADQQTALRERIKQILTSSELSTKAQISLNFALGKQYDDIGQFDTAFSYYQQGNQLRMRKDFSGYDISQFRDAVSAQIEFFSKEFLQTFSSHGSQSQRPVIIFGMPRSGTTLTEQILASHSQVYGGGELRFFEQLEYKLRQESHSIGWPFCINEYESGRFSKLAESYLDYLNSFDRNAARVTNKLPHNFVHVGLIYLLFPNAYFIHCIRQPIDNCLSIYFQNFASSHPYSCDLKTLGEYYLEYQRLVDHWRSALPASILEMSYQETVNSFEERAKRLIEFCQLPWEDRCIDFHETKRSIRTASAWQARQKIYTTSVDRWRNYEGHLQPLIEALAPLGV